MAPSITNYAEIQNDEIEVLRSIYMDDFVEEQLKTGAWNKIVDRSFSIRLRNSLGDENKAALSLNVSLPPTYPKTFPRLRLDFDEDVRPNTRKQAQNIIESKPKALNPGTEAIYEITVSLQEVLDNAVKNNSNDVPTLDEERTLKEFALLKAREEEKDRQVQTAETVDAEAAEEEERLLQELVEQEKNRSAQRKLSKTHSATEQPNFNPDVAGAVQFDQSAIVRDRSGKIHDFRMVFNKVIYQETPVATIFTVHVWQRNNDSRTTDAALLIRAPFLLLKECFVLSTGLDDKVKKGIQNLEMRLDEQTHGQTSHPNVVKPINYLISRCDVSDASASTSAWTVSILSEMASKGSLSEVLEIAGQLSDLQKLRAWALQILEGLHHYHRQGSVHGGVHLNNILLEQGEAKNIVVKLSDGVYGRDLHLLKRYSGNALPLAWKAPEDTIAQAEASSASDIWYLGVCLLQMGFGKDIINQYHSPAALISESELSRSFGALLGKVFDKNPQKRPSAWNALHFEFFRNDDALVEQYDHDLGRDQSSIKNLSSSLTNHHRRESTIVSTSSRYAKEFVEDGKLGRGGFGEVFRARNRIDGQLYAVKKIKAHSRAALDPVLSEASVLSRLNHPNVVRYYASWIDDASRVEKENESKLSTEETASSLGQFTLGSILPQSSRGLDFISSNNAHIVFGDDTEENIAIEGEDANRHKIDLNSDDGSSDETDESSDSDATEDHSGLIRTTTGETGDGHATADIDVRIQRKQRPMGQSVFPDREQWTVLFIQMEYCRPETLRDLINAGIQSNSHEGYRLFRQIVQGLAHIHAASIVHRDLKPENIFIDASGDVRIGDFGLARPGDYRTIDHGGTNKTGFLGSFTKDIGTASYVAPEVQSAGGGKYNEKADMYSLGVVFLEMNVIFATGMERVEGLAALQKANPTLPPALDDPQKNAQAAIIRSLVKHEPSLRPSSLDLLNSGQIPVQDEDEVLHVARGLVTDPNSHLRQKLIDGLFLRQAPLDQIYDTYGPERGPSEKLELLGDVSAMSRSMPEDLELQALVKERLASIFRRHGAVERTDTPSLFPYHPCYPCSEVLRFLSPSGKILQLPYDLVLPSAMLLARAVNIGLKRTFVFDTVYRIDPTRDRPSIFGEANFDIVSADGSDNLAIHEAEVIKALDEILDTFPSLTSAHMCYHINHSGLLNSILSFCDVHQQKWSSVKETISKLNTSDWTWSKVRHELRAPPISIPGTCLDELERFDFRDSLEEGIGKLHLLLQTNKGLESTFDRLRTIVAHIIRFGVKRKIYLSPLSSYNEKFYSSNVLFQCIYDQKKRSVFAAGGRYDELIRDHQPIATRKNLVRAVGFQFTWSGLSMGMGTYLKAQSRTKSKRKIREIDKSIWSDRRCEVLVDSFDRQLLESVGIEILRELWANDISATIEEREYGISDDYLGTDGNKNRHGWIVLIKSKDMIKVKATGQRFETELRLSELTNHLRNEMRERDREESRLNVAKAQMPRQMSHEEQSGNFSDNEPEIKVVMSQVKSKKINRKTIVEEARSRAQEWRVASQRYPIIAIEVKEHTFVALEKTNIHDSDSWKRLIHEAPSWERQYLPMVQSTLENVQGSSAVFIYNFRTKQIMHYHLSKVQGEILGA